MEPAFRGASHAGHLSRESSLRLEQLEHFHLFLNRDLNVSPQPLACVAAVLGFLQFLHHESSFPLTWSHFVQVQFWAGACDLSSKPPGAVVVSVFRSGCVSLTSGGS